MKKPKLIYPETFIAEREVDGKTEYAFAIKRSFLGLFKYPSIEAIIEWDNGWESIPALTEAFSTAGTVYHDSPEPVKEAIDTLRKDVEDDYQKKLKTWHRKQTGEWKYKPYP